LRINTSNFGEIAFEPNQVIQFPDGLPGFEDEKEFVLLNNYDTEDPVPFMWLQAAKNPDLALVVAIPFFLKPTCEFELPEDAVNRLKISEPAQVGIYTICKVADMVEDLTFNLASPIIINATTRIGEQVVLDNSPYTVAEKFVKS